MLSTLRLLHLAMLIVTAQTYDAGTADLRGAVLREQVAVAGEPYECIDDEHPREVRKDDDDVAQRYKFSMKYKDAYCVDSDKNRYQYGQMEGKIKTFSKCAEKCVQKTNSTLLTRLVGFDWKCTGTSVARNTCRCLYSKYALGNQTEKSLEKEFAEVNMDYDGTGPVEGGEKGKTYWYCARLVQAEPLEGEELEEYLRTSRRGLWAWLGL